MIDINVLKAAVMDSRDGITISDFTLADNPLVFTNPAFERMTGYSLEEIVGKNCRYLQGEDKDQEDQLVIIRAAIKDKQPCLVTLRNYKKDGTMFWNELSMSPIFEEDGTLTHFIGIQKDITAKVLIEEQLKGDYNELKRSKTVLEYLVNVDALTGINNRRFLEEQLDIQWKIAKRQKQLITIMMIDIDHFKKYNDIYGHPAGDQAIKRVAEVLSSSFLRSTDFVARYGGEEFIILAIDGKPEQIRQYADRVLKKVADLDIPHSGSGLGKLSISLGFRTCQPEGHESAADIIKQADEALYQAKKAGRNQAIAHVDSIT
jgi:diguanylate cyclase (GGDEF)-like protein/PAS domain S-box-containing protein